MNNAPFGLLACWPAAAAAEALYGPCSPVLLHRNPILLHSSSIWLLLLVLMLLLKPHMALEALYCCKTA